MHQFVAVFKEWLSNRVVGLSVLQAIESDLSRINAPVQSSINDAVIAQLQALAPSPALSMCIKSGCMGEQQATAGRPAFELQDNYIILQNCAREAMDLSQRLAELCETLTRIAMQGTSAHDVSWVPPAALCDAAEARKLPLQPPDDEGDGSHDKSGCRIGATGQGQGGPSDLEVALMATAVAEAVARETSLMASLKIV